MIAKYLKDSKTLLADFGFLAEQNGWAEFMQEFDKPSSIRKRMETAKSWRREASDSIRELEAYCRTIRLEYPLFSRKRPDGTIRTMQEIARDRMAAAVALAERVTALLKPSEEGRRLRAAVNAEAKRQGAGKYVPDKATPWRLVCFAFLNFVRREMRLPLKKELNIEAHRLSCSRPEANLGSGLGEFAFGDFVRLGDGNASGRVYDYRTEITLVEKGGWRTWRELRIVPKDQWDKPHWPILSSFSGYTTPLGLKGLQDAHKDKGRRVIGQRKNVRKRPN